jgi:hypothetical protein
MGFGDDVAKWTAKTEVKIETAIRKIAIDVFAEVIMMSPVDTGRFRGNWQVAIGSVPTGTLELDDKAGTATLSAAQAKALELKAGQTIFLVNNLPYAEALEYGHSEQAPGGMIRLTVQRWKPIVEAVGRELSKQ